jgi:GNAT superfamily N-acetyltransferase
MYGIGTLFANVSRPIRLKDGSFCRIRPLSRADRHLLVDCFRRLSPSSRRMRFFGVKPGLSEADLDYFSNSDGYDHIALVAVRLNARGEEQGAVGFARCFRLENDLTSAEVSLAVADDVQRLGAGAALLGQLTRVAQRAGVRRFLCEVLAENRGMRALASRMGGVCRWQGDGMVEYAWPLHGGLALDDVLWSVGAREELGKSVNFWLSFAARAMSIGFDHCDTVLRGIPDARTFVESQYLPRWVR